MRNDAIQKKLLTVDGLPTSQALEIAQGIKAADKNEKELKGTENLKLHESLNFAGTNKAKPCYCCGCHHDSKTCKFRDAEYHTCGKTGNVHLYRISHVMDDGNEWPIPFASRTLLPSEKNYSQVEREALSHIRHQ